MTPQDIEKLKAFCDEKGIEMIPTEDRDVWEFKSKDIWKGVEFAECIDNFDIGNDVTIGKVYKCKIGNDELYIIDDKGEEDGFIRYEENFKPSTESAYVEQLKDKAKELYGEIKDGDRFDRSEMEFGIGEVRLSFNGWDYCKSDDKLYFGTICIYQQGKWAKKVEEPIKANITSFTLSNPYSTIVFTTSHTIKDGQVDVKEFMNHIEESIEAFLNRKR